MTETRETRKAASADHQSSEVSESAPTIWTPANIVTCIRIVFVPVWVAFALSIGVATTTPSEATTMRRALTKNSRATTTTMTQRLI